MSMQTWTTYAYGVREDDIDKISIATIWPIFQNIMRAENEAKFDEALSGFCEDGGFAIEELNEDNIDEFIRLYYENNFDRVCTHSTALVLAELVARNLRIDFNDVITEANEDGQIIVGIGLYYPWQLPEVLKNAKQEDYEEAFINAFAILGIDGHYCDISEQSLEDWG